MRRIESKGSGWMAAGGVAMFVLVGVGTPVAATAQTPERVERERQERILQHRLEAVLSRSYAERLTGVPAEVRAPAPWLRQDPADSLYRVAREALNEGRYERAASVFEEIRSRFPRSGYVPDSYYYEALALRRARGGPSSLERALSTLKEQMERYPEAPTAEDGQVLAQRIQRELERLEIELERLRDQQAGLRENVDEMARRAEQLGRRAEAMARRAQMEAELARGEWGSRCEDDEARLRATALAALLGRESGRTESALREVLKSRDECTAMLRRRAVFLLGERMSPETVEVLLDLVHRNPDPDPGVREAAIFWLSRAPSEQAVPALESVLRESEDPGLQERALFAIGRHEGERAAEVVRGYAARDDAPAELRANAVFILGRMSESGNTAFLRDLYEEIDDEEVRERIVLTIARSPSEADRRWLLDIVNDVDQSPEIRRNALLWAARSAEDLSASELLELYRGLPDRATKTHLIRLLGRRDGSGGVDALMTVAREEEDAELRELAVVQLGESDDPRVVDFLLELVRGGG